MPAIGGAALGIVGGGVMLGALLGAFADPVMKAPPERPLPLTDRLDASASGSSMVESGPEPLPGPSGYRPALDYDAVITSYWTPPDEELAFDDGTAEALTPDLPAPDYAEAVAAADAALRAAETARRAGGSGGPRERETERARGASGAEPRRPDSGLPALW